MSRGPGVWQRKILAAVADGNCCYVLSLLPDGYTRADYNALHRAAVRQANEKRISYWPYLCGAWRVVVTPPGVEPSRPTLQRRHALTLSDGKGPA